MRSWIDESTYEWDRRWRRGPALGRGAGWPRVRAPPGRALAGTASQGWEQQREACLYPRRFLDDAERLLRCSIKWRKEKNPQDGDFVEKKGIEDPSTGRPAYCQLRIGCRFGEQGKRRAGFAPNHYQQIFKEFPGTGRGFERVKGFRISRHFWASPMSVSQASIIVRL